MQSARTKKARSLARSTARKGGARIQERSLRNGMRVLLVERHADPVVAVILWYKAGARNEREDEAGVSHFLEHMMFKGSRAFGKGEIDRVTTALGGSNNAFTSYDHTAYWFELASDRWEHALAIEADRMRHLHIEPAEFAAERAVVLEELSMGLDDPWRHLTERVQEVLFERHPYRRPIIGYPDALKALTPAAMRDYYRRFYHPGNATLVLCGDFSPPAAMRLVKRHFGSIPAGPDRASADCFRPAIADPIGEKRLTTSWDDQGRRLIMAWPSAKLGAADDHVLDVVANVLAGGRSARLHRSLVVERGLATSVAAHNDARVESGVFWLMAECAQGIEPETLERAIDAELERLRTVAVPPSELARVKSMIAASEAYEEETVTDLAESLGEFAVDADWRLALHALERIRTVTAADVRDVAARLLTRERRVVGWCLPRAAAQSKVGRKTAKRVARVETQAARGGTRGRR
jgi:zinc protease